MSGIENKETAPFPAGLRVLVVDADPASLLALERLLLACHYQVTLCHRASDALTLLREKEGLFDIVMSEIHLPGGTNGLQLLDIINGLQMDLPVVMMSQDGRQDMVMKIIMKGACDYLLKPVRLEEIRVIWQHVVRKRTNFFCNSYTLSQFLPEDQPRRSFEKNHQEGDIRALPVAKQTIDNHEKDAENRKDHKGVIIASLKKPRMVWTTELHDQFVAIIDQVGLKNAVPKKILEFMNVPGLTRENVASHLQKYRLHLRRKHANTQNKLKVAEEASNIGNEVAKYPCPGDHFSSEAHAISKQLESQCSVYSEKMNVPVDYDNHQGILLGNILEESIHQSGQKTWPCYDAAAPMIFSNHPIIMPPPDHGTPPDIVQSDQAKLIVMQRLAQSSFRIEMTNDHDELGRDEAALNQQDQMNLASASASYVSLSVPSTISCSMEDETEVEDTQNASTFILNVGDSGYDFCPKYQPTTYLSC